MTTSLPPRRVLTDPEAIALSVICERLVQGSSRTGAVDYVDRLAQSMPAADLLDLRASISQLARLVDDDAGLAEASGTAGFGLIRSLVIEAFYGDYAPEGYDGPTGHDRIDFHPPQADRLRKDWSFLDERVR